VAGLKIKSNIDDYIKMLKKTHSGLPVVSSDTVNTAGKVVERRYKKSLDSFKLRNKFTKGAILLVKSKPKRGSGDFRKIRDINSIVGVRKMKGGKDHYLKDQEEGNIKTGHPKTDSIPAMPLDTGRTGKSRMKPVRGPLRLQKSEGPQKLKVAGDPLGMPGTPFTNRQSWAIFHKYAGSAKAPNRTAANRYGWNLSRQFFFTGLKEGFTRQGVFKKDGNRTTMVRLLSTGKTVKVRARRKFSKSVDALTPTMMESIFKRSADKFLRR
jgi:hypothetical protein